MNKLHFSPRNIFPLFVAAFVLLLAILACGGITTEGGAPVPVGVQSTAPVSDERPTAIATTAQPAMPERRYLKLEFPPRIRTGDSDIIRLTLEVDDQGNIVPTAEVVGNIVTGEVIEIPNIYQTHHVVAEARFDIAGMEVRPTELISTPISQGQTAVFYWSIRAADTGIYRGTIWLYLRFVDKSNGEEIQKAVSAQIVEIEAVNFFGFPVNVARSFGVVGSVIGTIIGFPFFEDIVKYFLKNRQKSKI